MMIFYIPKFLKKYFAENPLSEFELCFATNRNKSVCVFVLQD
jgi:hypothetical protein